MGYIIFLFRHDRDFDLIYNPEKTVAVIQAAITAGITL
jgi:hypothetical protein